MSEQPIKEWQVVMAELKEGTASVGVRFNREDTVHFFLLHKPLKEAVQMVASIARREMTLQDIALYDWRAVTLPYKEAR
jgi:hypothetical protein